MGYTNFHTPNHHTMFSRDTSSNDHLTCARPVPGLVGDPLYPDSGITFHKLTILICAPCLGITTLSSGYLAWKHVRNYTAPQEQRQILRIIALPIFYSLSNFLALCWYRTYQYIQPIAGVYESFAIAALFFLLLEWVCPEGTDREKYFDEFPFKDKKGVIVEGGSLDWFHVSLFACNFCHCIRPDSNPQSSEHGPKSSNTRSSPSSSQSSKSLPNIMANTAPTLSHPNMPTYGSSSRGSSSSQAHCKPLVHLRVG